MRRYFRRASEDEAREDDRQSKNKASNHRSCQVLGLEQHVKHFLAQRAGSFECGETNTKEIGEEELLSELHALHKDAWEDVYFPFLKACFLESVERLETANEIRAARSGTYRRLLFSGKPWLSWSCRLGLAFERNARALIAVALVLISVAYVYSDRLKKQEIETALEAELLAKRIREKLIEQQSRRKDARRDIVDEDDSFGYPIDHLRDYAKAVWYARNPTKHFAVVWRKVKRIITSDSRIIKISSDDGQRWKWAASLCLENDRLA